ncbi:MAG: hypothetical protein ACFB9M_16200 [Myxococcota bacterium]
MRTTRITSRPFIRLNFSRFRTATIRGPSWSGWVRWAMHDGRWLEVGAFGTFRDEIARSLGFDPRRTSLVAAGLGLERLAAIRFGIDDIRKVSALSVSKMAKMATG